MVRIGTDSYTNPEATHQKQIEPHVLASGSVVVAAMQSGRYPEGGGATNIDWATSTDAGETWTQGQLPDTTSVVGGAWDRISDPVVARSERHSMWLIFGLVINVNDNPSLPADETGIAVSRSADGLQWEAPVIPVAGGGIDSADKEWAVCDNAASSRYYGRCYVAWTDGRERFAIAYSDDAGASWSEPARLPDQGTAFNIQLVVQPSGRVVFVALQRAGGPEQSLSSAYSDNGAVTWNRPKLIADSLIAYAAVDAGGTVWMVAGRTGGRLVLSRSDDGAAWSSLQTVQLPPQVADFTVFGMALATVPRDGSPAAAVLGYYRTDAMCELCVRAGLVFISTAGGRTSRLIPLSPRFSLAWTSPGNPLGEYAGITAVNDVVYPVFSVAAEPTDSRLDQAIFAIAGGVTTESLGR